MIAIYEALYVGKSFNGELNPKILEKCKNSYEKKNAKEQGQKLSALYTNSKVKEVLQELGYSDIQSKTLVDGFLVDYYSPST